MDGQDLTLKLKSLKMELSAHQILFGHPINEEIKIKQKVEMV